MITQLHSNSIPHSRGINNNLHVEVIDLPHITHYHKVTDSEGYVNFVDGIYSERSDKPRCTCEDYRKRDMYCQHIEAVKLHNRPTVDILAAATATHSPTHDRSGYYLNGEGAWRYVDRHAIRGGGNRHLTLDRAYALARYPEILANLKPIPTGE